MIAIISDGEWDAVAEEMLAYAYTPLAEEFPWINTGDVRPETHVALLNALRDAAKQWVSDNDPRQSLARKEP